MVGLTMLMVALVAVMALTNTAVVLQGEGHNRWEASILADRLLEETRGQDLSKLPTGPFPLADVPTQDGMVLHPTRELTQVNANPPTWRLRFTVRWTHRDRPYVYFREAFLTVVHR